MALPFPDKPRTTVAELQTDVSRLILALKPGAEAFVIKAQTIATVETPIRHGLRTAPQAISITPRAATGFPYQSRDPDTQFVYLQASVGSVVVDILVIP